MLLKRTKKEQSKTIEQKTTKTAKAQNESHPRATDENYTLYFIQSTKQLGTL